MKYICFVVCLIVCTVQAQTGCSTCSSVRFTNAITPTVLAAGQIQTSPALEVIPNVGSFRLVRVGGASPAPVFLASDFNFTGRGCCEKFCGTCPLGYRPATAAELKLLIALDASSITTLGMTKAPTSAPGGRVYVSSDRSNTDKGCGNATAWMFNVVSWPSATTALSPSAMNTYFPPSGSLLRFKCVRASTGASGFAWTDGADFVNGVSKLMPIAAPSANWIAFNYSIKGVSLPVTAAKQINFAPTTTQCHSIFVQYQLFGGATFSECVQVYSRPPFGKNTAPPAFTPANIKTFTFSLPSIPLRFNTYWPGTFSSQSAPIAPFTGGFYLVWTDVTTNQLSAMNFTNAPAQVGVTKKLNLFGTIHDAVAHPAGDALFILLRLKNKLSIVRLDRNFNVVYNSIIMDNPTNNQTRWWNKPGEAVYGTNYIFDPTSGRLAFGQNRIAAIFAHYNDFNKFGGGNGGNHTGGTIITCDASNGRDQLLGAGWISSHSLAERLIWDDTNFVSAQLGDAYPQSITLASFLPLSKPAGFLDPVLNTNNRIQVSVLPNTIFPGLIPGNGGGKSSGHLGGLHKVTTNKWILTYSRKALTPQPITEIGFIRFSKNSTGGFKQEVYKSLLSGVFDITSVKSEKFGDRIFVYYSRNAAETASTFVSVKLSAADTRWVLVATVQGVMVSNVQLTTAPIPLSTYDDLEVLSDGSIVWNDVDITKPEIKIHKVTV